MAVLPSFETLVVQDLRQEVQLGIGIPHSDPEKEGSVGRLKVVGIAVEEAASLFQRPAYGQVFPSFE